MKKAMIGLAILLAAGTGCSKESVNNSADYGSGSSSGVSGVSTLNVTEDQEDFIANTNFDRTITITFNAGGTASVSGDAHGIVSVSGNKVTADNTTTSEKVRYELSGSATDGYFKVYSNNKQAIVLNNLSLTNPNGAAINNQGKKRCFVVVGGTNTLADGSSYTATPSDEDEKAAFFSEGQLIFSGDGSLTVSAKGKSGIVSDDYLHFVASPTVKVTSTAGHAVRGKDAVIVSDGVLEATASAAMKKGVASDSLVLFNGGATTIKVSGGTAYDSEDAEYKSSAGIKADNYFGMTGGTVTITNTGAGGKGVRAGNYSYYTTNGSLSDSYISGGTLTIKTSGSESNDVSTKAIKIGFKEGSGRNYVYGGNLVVSGGSIIANTSKSETIETKGKLTITNGSVYAYSTGDDAINSQGEMNISGGYVYGHSTANDAIDTNCDMKISGGYVFAVTTKGSPEVALDANTEGGYKLYIYSGATVVAYGGLESGYSASQTVYSMSGTANAWNALWNGSSFIAAFKAPSGASSFAVSAPSLSSGYKGVSVGSTTYCNGVWATSGISGGTSVSLSSYSGGGNQGGGPGGGRPGGGHGW